MKNKLRRALLEREVTLGSWIQIGHPACAEVMARAGFDWVCVDLEHGVIDLETTADIFRALGAFDCVPVARLPLNDPIWIHRTLDAGARGLIIPMVKTAAEAEAAVREAKYPPRGVRGFGYSRANLYGADFDSYIASANDEIALVMQIEHKDAIANLDAILCVDGVDGVFIGPNDLAADLGHRGNIPHPEVQSAITDAIKRIRAHGKAPGILVGEADGQRMLDAGALFVAVGSDVGVLRMGATNLAKKFKK